MLQPCAAARVHGAAEDVRLVIVRFSLNVTLTQHNAAGTVKYEHFLGVQIDFKCN